MRLIDNFGDNVTNLADLEPWCHFVEYDGIKSPILLITYASAIPAGLLEGLPDGRRASIKIEWDQNAD